MSSPRTANARPVTYTAHGQRMTQAPRPFARQKLVAGSDDATRVRQLEQQIRELERATEAARSVQSARVVEQRMESGKEYMLLEHRFGRRAKWRVVDWVPDTAGWSPALERVAHGDEANTLRVTCSSSGVYTIEVS